MEGTTKDFSKISFTCNLKPLQGSNWDGGMIFIPTLRMEATTKDFSKISFTCNLKPLQGSNWDGSMIFIPTLRMEGEKYSAIPSILRADEDHAAIPVPPLQGL